MQFMNIASVKPGMKLGKNIYHTDGRILLRAGAEIHTAYIDKLKGYGYKGIYVDDPETKDIEINDIITDELRTEMVKKIKSIYTGLQDTSVKFQPSIDVKIREAKKLIENIIDQILDNETAIVNIIDLKNYDEYTFQHSVNVAVISIVLGVVHGFNRSMLFNLGMAALFHDIGKLRISPEILNKPGKLDEDEFEIIKKHPRYGYEFMRGHFDIHTIIYVAILEHHEKFDGSGYPDGIAGDNIVLPARIIAVSDVYDAITSLRPYHAPMLPSEAFEYIMSNSAIHFDPEIVKLFITRIAPYPIGTTVMLSDNTRGVVAKNYEDCIMRPQIKIIPENPEVGEFARYIDLRNDAELVNVVITKVVQ